ncbi:hypothetical protein [Clostridium yunnanense]|nr:hypothetical protein [Clostridium yunnanense]
MAISGMITSVRPYLQIPRMERERSRNKSVRYELTVGCLAVSNYK